MAENITQAKVWNIPKMVSQQTQPWDELHRIDPMSFGIYTLAAGATDKQSPHNEDEVYYVVAGKSKLEIGDEIRDIQQGDLIFVPKQTHHRYVEIKEDLTLLAVIAPAYNST